MGKIVVAGGGMCGLAAAMMLADDGHDVVVLERDDGPPATVDDAFDGWSRRGVAQFGLAHWLHARGTQVMRDHTPRAYELLDEAGGLHFNMYRYIAAAFGGDLPDDVDRYDNLTGRRSTMEWAMATAADEHPRITVRRGVSIAGLVTGAEATPGIPHVTGFRLADGEEVTGDLTIDATGRRSPTPDWLAAIGALPPHEDAEDSGFAYYSRYYRSADGSMPPFMGGLLTPYGTFSTLTLPADNGTWTATVYGLSEDRALRACRSNDVHERVFESLPLAAHLVDAEPISDVGVMSGVVDRHRQFVVDGTPCATGVLTVGDASSCTNPSLGRGITIGLLHVTVLRESVANHIDDPLALALDFHERTESEVRPWHDATITLDRRRVNEMRTYLAGGTPEPTPQEQLGDVMAASIGHDETCRRAFLDMMTCTTLPGEVFSRPGFVEHLMSLSGTVQPTPAPGPNRAELEELLA